MPKSNFNIIYMRKILLTYGDIKTINIGDYIQSIAAKQFLMMIIIYFSIVMN